MAQAALLAEYRFEENSYSGAANEVIDTSGNGHHGRMLGGVSSHAGGKTCRGMFVPQNLTTAIQALDTGLDVNTIGNVGSISFWYKSITTDNAWRMLFDATTGTGARFYLQRDDDNSGVDLNFELSDAGGTLRDVDKLNALTDGVWGHVALTWSAPGGRLKLYVNGAEVDSQTPTFTGGALNSAIGTLYFGDNRNNDTYKSPNSAYGYFDTIRIYNHELSATQVQADYTATPPCAYLHHLEITAGSASAGSGASVPLTLRACANADCSSLYTAGLTGNLSITGVTPTYTTGQSFSIGATGVTTETVSMTSGSAVFNVTGLSVTPALNPAVWCGLGGSASSASTCTMPVASGLHHVELTTTSANALTCTPITYTIRACSNASCSTPYTAGLTGTLAVSGTTVNYPAGSTFAIASGSSTTTITAHATTVGTATAALGGLSVAPSNSPATFCGMGQAAASGASCAVAVANSALVLSLPNHAAGTSQVATISAVRASDDATVCTPAFASTTKSINLKCAYTNPITGTVPVKIGGVALNATALPTSACDATGRSVSLAFNASGVASTTLLYEDAGQVTVTASYSGSGSDAGLSMSGSRAFVAAPSSFAFTTVSSGTLKAGQPFSARVEARNALGQVMPNFGRETAPEGVRFTWTKASPSGAGSSAGILSGAGATSTLTGFSGGAATATDLRWSEAGRGDLTATLGSGNYLGSGLTFSGSTGSLGAVGSFVADHFRVALVPGCGSFTYGGQPFALTVTARNAANGVVTNHSGSLGTATLTTLAITPGTTAGSLSTASVPASAFSGGVATLSDVRFNFAQKLTAPTTLAVTASDLNGITTTASDGNVHTASLAVRSGRLRLSNAFGTEREALTLPVQLQYWAGRNWALNSLDSCTVVPASAVVLDNHKDARGAATQGWGTSVTPVAGASAIVASGGVANLVLARPASVTAGQAPVGTVDVGINLGTGSTDAACLPTLPRPASTGAGLPWLRSQYGRVFGCTGSMTYLHDPSARATFGVYAPEVRRMIHIDEAP